jgi:cyanobactin maturation PatA/PatG family protease
MLQPSETDNASEQLQPSEAINLSLKQPGPQSSAIAIQAAEAKTSTSVPTAMSIGGNQMMVTPSNKTNASVTPSECASCSGGGQIQLVYALGELGYDFGTQARGDSFTQAMPAGMSLLDYIEQNPWEAQSLIWTLNLDATPIYAIVPSGSYANIAYDRLRSFLADTNVERVSIPGYIGGSVRLMSGQVVPVIIPEVRGLYSWSVSALVSSVTAATLPAAVTTDQVRNRIEDYVNRVYYDYRNLGVTPKERALNFSATNAFQASTAIASATSEALVLDTISVEKSPICRPDSDCYDVKLIFFDPENNQRANRVYRFTIDVSEVIPVTIGQVRSWSQS